MEGGQYSPSRVVRISPLSIMRSGPCNGQGSVDGDADAAAQENDEWGMWALNNMAEHDIIINMMC